MFIPGVDGPDDGRSERGEEPLSEGGERADGAGAAEQGDEDEAAGAGGPDEDALQGHHRLAGEQDQQPGGAAGGRAEVSASPLIKKMD